MEPAHARLSASSSSRWLRCPGSIKQCEGIPRKSSPYADEGTKAHELAEMKLLRKPFDHSDYSDEMHSYVDQYVGYVNALPGDHHVETRVNYSAWVDGGFGTADFIAVDGINITIVDLKYGQGLKVYAENNSQLMLYALGVVSMLRVKGEQIHTITMTVHQPRLNHVDSYAIGILELLAWGDWAQMRSKLCDQAKPELVPGDIQCQFCPANPCPALHEHTQVTLMSQFDNMNLPEINTLSDEQLRRVLDNKKLIQNYLDAIDEHVKSRLIHHGSLPGYKLVDGRGTRQWIDEEAATRKLKRTLGAYNAIVKKPLSVAQAEKKMGKGVFAKEFGKFISKTPGGPVLAKDSDKREAINISVDSFDKLT